MTHVYTKEAYPELNRKKRKELEAARIRSTSDEARLIKACDLKDNARTIKEHDSEFWETYRAEILRLVDCLPFNPIEE